MTTRKIRAAAAVAAAGAIILGGASAASAHVRVIPDTTASGSYAKLTFRVPNESDTASTTRLEVSLPEKTPMAYVSAQPIPGWTVSTSEGPLAEPVTVEGSTITKATLKVTWTASSDQDAIQPGEFQEFSLSAGPLPAAATDLAFPAKQTYSDGKVVEWNQPQPAGADEPENPVPAFMVTAAGAGDDHGATGEEPAGDVAESSGDSSSSGVAIGLGAAGLIAGLAGLGAGTVALRRSGQVNVKA